VLTGWQFFVRVGQFSAINPILRVCEVSQCWWVGKVFAGLGEFSAINPILRVHEVSQCWQDSFLIDFAAGVGKQHRLYSM